MLDTDPIRLMEDLVQASPNEEGMLELGLFHWTKGNLVEAHKWLSLASDRNNPYARIHEKELAREMTVDQVNEARRQASPYREAKFCINSMAFKRTSSAPVDVPAAANAPSDDWAPAADWNEPDMVVGADMVVGSVVDDGWTMDGWSREDFR